MRFLLLILPLFLMASEYHNFGHYLLKDDQSFYSKSQFPKQLGQCTWFVDGAVRKSTGINLPFKYPYGRHAKNWDTLLPYKVTQEPIFPSIAIWGGKYGHVAFVEHIDPTEGNNPRIYFREANFPIQNGKIDKYDGVLKMLPLKKFKRRIRNFKGFIDLTIIN